MIKKIGCKNRKRKVWNNKRRNEGKHIKNDIS